MQSIITLVQLNSATRIPTTISSESNLTVAFMIAVLIALIVLIIILIRTNSIRKRLKPMLGYGS